MYNLLIPKIYLHDVKKENYNDYLRTDRKNSVGKISRQNHFWNFYVNKCSHHNQEIWRKLTACMQTFKVTTGPQVK